ncbi:MAG: hypothetical protein AB8B55_01345 [Mariniblastus sp.]
MDPFEFERIAGTTWAYLSSLLMLALFFKFNRFWSFRNFDLILIILLAPGLLMVEGGKRWVLNYDAQQAAVVRAIEKNKAENSNSDEASNDATNTTSKTNLNSSADETTLKVTTSRIKDDTPNNVLDDNTETTPVDLSSSMDNAKPDPLKPKNTLGYEYQRLGYYWLFIVGAIMMVRLLIDPSLTRRPLLEPNLSVGGLVFFACSLMIFLFANIITSEPTPEDLRGARNAVKLIQREAAGDSGAIELRQRGPGYTLFNLIPIIPSFESGGEILKTDADQQANMSRYVIAAKSLAIVSQMLIVLGLVAFCHYNYNNFYVGVGTATVYLMLPYTAIFTGHVLHVLPAALILWAMVSFRRPMVAGILFGFATGVSYYPIFLLALWASFYWKRGVGRFMIGTAVSLSICIGGLAFTSIDTMDFFHQVQAMFGFWSPIMDGLDGIWALGWNQWWRLPLLVAFVLFCVSFVAWPSEKNIGTLASYSAAIMVAVQFWHGFGGGLYMGWYMPMVLLVVFRPNLNGRVALAELRESKRPHRESPEDLLPTS